MNKPAPGPLTCYQRDLDSGKFNHDESQHQAVRRVQQLFEYLVEDQEAEAGRLQKLVERFSGSKKKTITGLYLWGGVGRGKTWIVDTFFACLPFENKMRMHFNRFMYMVHDKLKALPDTQDPLEIVAADISSRARVICFDEFHVSDITDAMLLGGLLKALFEKRVVLVATSNEHPEKLYWDGLQRERFLPAIDLLLEYTSVVNVDGGIDYRLRYLDKADTYLTPLNELSQQRMLESFQQLSPDTGKAGAAIYVEHREIKTLYCADGVVWFDFPEICDGPRGAADYIEIARLYQTVLISNVPQMSDMNNDVCKRFITLIDEFYDRHVKLIVSAAAELDKLYSGKKLAQAFRRTQSRLVEMQTHEYLALAHPCD